MRLRFSDRACSVALITFATVLLAGMNISPALAQKRNSAKSTAPAAKPVATKPAAAAEKPAQPNAKTAEKAADKLAEITYSLWTKFCIKAEPANAKPVCFTSKDARLVTGDMAASAVLVDPEEKDSKKVLRVTLPLGMQLVPGTRIVIDQIRPAMSPYLICFSNGCMAEYDATSELINRLKKGKQLAIQAVNALGQAVSVDLPLEDFAKAYDGPPTDQAKFEEQQKKRRDEVLRRSIEVRELLARLTPPPGGAPPAKPDQPK